MTIRNLPVFNPEALLSAPRRGPGIPNEHGSKVLYSVTTYSFETHRKSSEIRVLDVKSSESTLVDDGASSSNPVWLDHETIALLRTTDDERTEFLIGNHSNFKKDCYVAGEIDTPADNLKVTKLDDGSYGVVVTALSNPDGSLYSPRLAKKPHSTGRLYRSLFVRHWDKWVTRQRNSIWYGALSIPKDDSQSTKPSHFSLSRLHNPLRGTDLESPIAPFGGTDHFDICKQGLIYISKDPNLDPAVNTKCNLYLVSLSTFCETQPTTYEVGTPPIMQGAMSSPVFSKDGSKLAVLMMPENSYEADKNRLLVMHLMGAPFRLEHHSDSGWDRSPSSIVFSSDDDRIYLTAQEEGEAQLFSWNYLREPRPQAVTDLRGTVDSVKILSNLSSSVQRVLISSTSLVENSAYSIFTITYATSLEYAVKNEQISALSGNGSKFGLHPSQISEIRSPRAANTDEPPNAVHSWVIKPSSFDPKKKYPLAFLIHGGPQDSWMNAWSTRWNPAIYAEQGYVVICPNPTGSTGYGQNFTDAIKEQWGGLPYVDLVKCFEYIEKELDFVDTKRAVALGASYGGYMVNWIQGHPLGRKFKALVTHDGVYSTPYELATEELYFVHREFGGPWSTKRESYEKWSPDQFTEHWKTPHLIIHSEKDYRLTVSDGLAAFNILQVQGVESEFLTFPEENHWVLNPENSLVWHETVLNFINKYVGLPPYTEGDDKDIVQDPPRLEIAPAEPAGKFERA